MAKPNGPELGLFNDEHVEPTGYVWVRFPVGNTHRANYVLYLDDEPTIWHVRWCGHPTALRPYYVIGIGTMQTYRTVAEAKAAIENTLKIKVKK